MDFFEVRDRRGGFLWVSNQIFDHFAGQVNSSTFMLYMALCRMANNETQDCFPSQSRLGKMIGVDERTVRRCMEELIAMKLVGIEKQGRAYRYTLLKTPDNLSAIDTGQKCTSIPDIFDKNTGHPCPTNKTSNKTKEQDSICPPSSDEKPSKKEDQDPRYTKFVDAISNGYKRRDWEFSFNGKDGKQLKSLLKDRPKWDVPTFQKCLGNYFSSEKVPPGGPPYVYLNRLPRYLYGPLNEFGKMLRADVKMAEDTTYYA